MSIGYIKPKRIFAKNTTDLNEAWFQKLIADDRSVLGLGELELWGKEVIQPKAGRLDLLLGNPATGRRYEVEVQLGATDPSHIIRTIEYWERERRRYPDDEHCAVLVAEEVTGRFLNVVRLLNGCVPLIAIQMQVFEVGDQRTVLFTRVVDEVRRGTDDSEESPVLGSREETAKHSSKPIMAMLDSLFDEVRKLDPGLSLKYNKQFVGLQKDGNPGNFLTFRPRKKALLLNVRIDVTEELTARIDEVGIEVLSAGSDKYRLRLSEADLTNEAILQFLRDLMKSSHDSWWSE